MQAQYDEIKSLGGELVVFSPELTDVTANLAGKQNLTFPIVRDDGLNIARSFGLVFEVPAEVQSIYQGFGIDLPKNTGHTAWELPMPARFVVDSAGIIQAASVDPDYTKRPEPEETMKVLRSLS